jgi:hypothetical protein
MGVHASPHIRSDLVIRPNQYAEKRPDIFRDAEVVGSNPAVPTNQVAALLANVTGGSFAPCDPFGIPSTSHWTAAAIIVQLSQPKTCVGLPGSHGC